MSDARKSCPYAKSDMTPCVIRDGDTCWAMDGADKPICVGCEHTPQFLGLPPPANWSRTVSDYYAKQRGR